MNEKDEKIQRFLARSGLGSRRYCEKLVNDMRVTINGDIAQTGQRVQKQDDVRVDGSRVRRQVPYFLKIYKPKGYLCTDEDKHNIKRVRDLFAQKKQRLFPIGRLDKDFEGLLIYTNDGELCHRLTHPRYKVTKIYEIRINDHISDDAIKKISKGIWLSEGKSAPMEIRVKSRNKRRTLVTINLTENRRRLIPRVFAKLDYHVDRVKRIGIGPIRLKGLKEGESRKLTEQEIRSLKNILKK